MCVCDHHDGSHCVTTSESLLQRVALSMENGIDYAQNCETSTTSGPCKKMWSLNRGGLG